MGADNDGEIRCLAAETGVLVRNDWSELGARWPLKTKKVVALSGPNIPLDDSSDRAGIKSRHYR